MPRATPHRLLLLPATLAALSLSCSSNTITGQVIQATALVSATRPENGEPDASIDSTIYVNFRDPIDSSTQQLITLAVESGGQPVPGTLSVSTTRATFTPDQRLVLKTSYQCAVSTGVRLVQGQLERPFYRWSFETQDSLPPPPPPGPGLAAAGASGNHAPTR